MALLGIRTSFKEDLTCMTAELVYGTSLRLPGESFTPQHNADLAPAGYISQLRHSMWALHYPPPRQLSHTGGHIDSALSMASHTCFRWPGRSPHNSHMMARTQSWPGQTIILHTGPQWPPGHSFGGLPQASTPRSGTH